MGKRLRQQHRGRGTIRYRVRKQAFTTRVSYPSSSGKGEVIKIFHSPAHSAPIAVIKIGKEKFYNIAAEGIYEKQNVEVGKDAEVKSGNILPLDKIPLGTQIFNIELNPFCGGKLVRTAGSFATVSKKTGNYVSVLLPSKEEKMIGKDARATIGTIACSGKDEKPFIRAGAKWYAKKARGKPYPLTSPVKMNAVDHPFGCGRGKNMGKSSIPRRHAPPGRNVGLIRASRTGRKKR